MAFLEELLINGLEDPLGKSMVSESLWTRRPTVSPVSTPAVGSFLITIRVVTALSIIIKAKIVKENKKRGTEEMPNENCNFWSY